VTPVCLGGQVGRPVAEGGPLRLKGVDPERVFAPKGPQVPEQGTFPISISSTGVRTVGKRIDSDKGVPIMKIRCFALILFSLWAATASGQYAFDAKDVRVRPDEVYGHRFGLALTFDVYTPRNSNGAAVLFINSGGYASGLMRQCEKGEDSGWRFLPADAVGKWDLPQLIKEQYGFQKLLAAGFTVFDIRHGSTPRFMIDEMFEDCSRAVRHIKFHAQEYGIDAGRVGLWGGSAGGHLALLLGTRVVKGKTVYKDVTGAFELNTSSEPELETSSSVRAVAVYYPAGYDLVSDRAAYPEIFKSLPALNVPDAVLDELSIKKYLGPANPPVLIIYGDQDMPFIVGASKNIAAGLKKNNADVETMVLPGVGHEFKGKDGSYENARPGQTAMDKLVEWFKTELLG
jgi:acetyl esterase/lipase